MARTAVNFDRKRLEIVDAAWQLFAAKGFEKTTVEAVIDHLKISKGTFYHYFDSKEEVLDAVCGRMTEKALEQVSPILEDQSLDAVERLNRFMSAVRRWRFTNMGLVKEVAAVMYRDENVIIRHKMSVRKLELVAPVLERIIVQGLREGSMSTPDPGEAARFVISVSDFAGELQMREMLDAGDPGECLRRVEARLEFVLDLTERILGMRKGGMERVGRDVLMKAILGFRGEAGPERK